jgi:protocatechuate 3,4-dioxygenase alpha subunit
MQAPHISFWLVARGINIGLNTRMYFPEDDHSADPVLTSVEHLARRQTLIATKTGPGLYRFDIRLQGDGETVFLDI